MNPDIFIVDEDGNTMSNTANNKCRYKPTKVQCPKCGHMVLPETLKEFGDVCGQCWLNIKT